MGEAVSNHVVVEEEVELRVKLYDFIALVHGYNALALRAEDIGARMYFRMARDMAIDEALKMGTRITFSSPEETPIVEVGEPPYGVNLYPRDIELMRKAVADFDARRDSEDKG